MKKQLLSLGLILAAIFTLTNCSKTEIETPQETKGTPFTIQLNVDTKTTNEGMSTKWATGDKVNVFHAEAGTIDYVNDSTFTVINTTTGIFQGNLNGSFTADYHDWYFFYPYVKQIVTPVNTSGGWTPIGSKYNEVQTQTGKNSKAHLAGSNFPLTCKLTNLHKDICPSGQMQQVASVIEIKVKNSLTDPLDITKVSFEAPKDIIGTYFIHFAGDLVTYTPSSPDYVSKTANLDVTGVSADAALAPNEVASFYIGIKPFTADIGDSLKIKVNNNLQKGIELASAVTFTAGKIKTLNFDYDVAPTPPAGIIATRADLETLNTATSYGSHTTTDGWVLTNCCVQVGGTGNNPIFECIGYVTGSTTEYAKAACLNGKTSAVGTLESPLIANGCGTLTFDYGNMYTESKGIDVTIEVIQSGTTVKTISFVKANADVAKTTKYTHSEVINVSGDFKLKFTNNSPSNSGSNKDRSSFWNITWTNHP